MGVIALAKINDKKRLAINIIGLVIMIIIAVFVINFHGFDKNKKTEDKVDFSGISKICELSTLRCYYHNVAELEKEPDGIYKYIWLKHGYKKLFMEYTGTIEVGIDVNQVEVNDPDENNIVSIYVPDAEIMNVSADSNTMGDVISDTGIFTQITFEDQEVAFIQAQKEMEEAANLDMQILNKAKSNAKKLIEQYIINVGEKIGESYEVQWLDEPKNKIVSGETTAE